MQARPVETMSFSQFSFLPPPPPPLSSNTPPLHRTRCLICCLLCAVTPPGLHSCDRGRRFSPGSWSGASLTLPAPPRSSTRSTTPAWLSRSTLCQLESLFSGPHLLSHNFRPLHAVRRTATSWSPRLCCVSSMSWSHHRTTRISHNS